jgi:hypothetical protein
VNTTQNLAKATDWSTPKNNDWSKRPWHVWHHSIDTINMVSYVKIEVELFISIWRKGMSKKSGTFPFVLFQTAEFEKVNQGWILPKLYLFPPSSLLHYFFIFSIDIFITSRTTNDDEQTVRLFFSASWWFSCLPWLTITFYIIHLSFDFRFATTMTTTLTTTTMLMTTPPLPYVAHLGCFKIFQM